MTQQATSVYILLRRFWMQLLLVQSLSWLSIVTLLSNNLVLAQTESSIDIVVPTGTSKPPVAPIVKSTLNAPQTAPTLVKVERLRSKIFTSPASVRVKKLRQKLSPTPVRIKRDRSRREIATPTAPRLSVPKVRSVAKPIITPASVQIRRTRTQTATNSVANYNGAYIDPTEYKIGATKAYEPSSTLVRSNRSTGCKAIVRQGQSLSGSICGTQPRRRTQVAIAGTRINSVRLSRSQTPSRVRSRAVLIGKILPIRANQINVSVSHRRANYRTPVPGQIASAKVQPRSVFYYNRTSQPTEQFGNGNTGLMFPLTIPAPITSLFGWRIHPITGNRRFHSGTDLGGAMATPVLAAYAGNVVIADSLGGYGLTIVLDHIKFNQQTLYAHMSEIFVQPGEWVEQGTVIGRVGSTGNSTGPHLHFETRQLTPEGWVANDPSTQLESALSKLVEVLRTTQSNQKLGA